MTNIASVRSQAASNRAAVLAYVTRAGIEGATTAELIAYVGASRDQIIACCRRLAPVVVSVKASTSSRWVLGELARANREMMAERTAALRKVARARNRRPKETRRDWTPPIPVVPIGAPIWEREPVSVWHYAAMVGCA